MLLIISQIIGLAAVGLYLLSYQLKKRRQIVWVTCVSNALYVLQYILLGAFSGAVMDFTSTVSSFLAAKKNDAPFVKYKKILMLSTISLSSSTTNTFISFSPPPISYNKILNIYQ